jgi:DNA polymerase III sliding clamp (beta) subunit (PCNA family)
MTKRMIAYWVIPPEADALQIELDTEEACRTAQRVVAVSGEQISTVRITVNGEGVDISANSDVAQADDFLGCAAKGDIVLGLNAKKLAAYLGALECETVRLSQAGKGHPVRLTPFGCDDRVGVIMPVAV